MINSVDDLIEGFAPFPDFELLDARSASVLNKIFQDSYFKKKVTLEEQKDQKADRFITRSTISPGSLTRMNPYLIMSTDLRISSEWRYSEFDKRLELSMEQFPSDDILESLYKLRIRVSA